MGSLDGMLFVYGFLAVLKEGILESGHLEVLTVGDISGTCIYDVMVCTTYPMIHRLV